MAGMIQRLEIFGAGSHSAATGKVTVTEADLDQIVEAFHSLQGTNIVKPHLKLGHTEAQKWFGQKNGVPSLGWITRVWREGTKLLADISDVPDALINLIKQRRFHNVSAEVYWDAPIKHAEKEFKRVLSAVAILGTEMPAVKDLAGLAEALFEAEPATFEGAEPTTITMEAIMPVEKETAQFSQEQVDTLTKAAVERAIAEAKTEFEAAQADLNAQLEVANSRAVAAEAQIAEANKIARTVQAEALVVSAIKDGKLLPKHKDFAMAMLTAGDGKVAFSDGEKTVREAFEEFINTNKVMQPGEVSGSDKPEDEVSFSSAADEVHVKTQRLMNKDKIDYTTAMQKVLAEDADLKQRYSLIQN